MHAPITSAAIALLALVLVPLRFLWPRTPERLRRRLPRLVIAAFAVALLPHVTHWGTRWHLVNSLLDWVGLACYLILLVLFTRLQPCWLTTISAIILFLPLFAASPMLRLAELFDVQERPVVRLSERQVVERSRWDLQPMGSTGADFTLFREARWAPFLWHDETLLRFTDADCDTPRVTFKVVPDGSRAIASCPPRPGKGETGSEDQVLMLR